MANLPESSSWDSVYQLEVTDRAQAGPNGILNTPAKNLANRDLFLLNKIKGLALNVKDFGAIGNNVANDTAAIQSAIDAAFTAGGGEVFFPVGTYCYTRLVLKSKVSLIGVGRSSSILRCTDLSAGSSVQRADDNSTCFFNRIENLQFCTALSSITAAQDTSQTLIGLNLAGVGYSHIENVSVQGFGGGGIVLARCENGAEGLGFTGTAQDGNYNTIINAQLGGNGKYNADGAALWFKYKANSNKLMSLLFKGAGTVNAIVVAYGSDNLFAGASFESLARGIWFKSLAFNNSLSQARAEGLDPSVSPAFSTAIIKADAGSSGNVVIGVHQSSAAVYSDIEAGAFCRIFAGPLNILRSGELSTTNLGTTSDHHFLDTLGLLTDSTGITYVKSPGYGDGTTVPKQQLRNTIISTTIGMTLAEWQAFNNDSSTNARGANARIRAKAFTTSGRSGFSFLTGSGDKPNEVLELDQHVKVTGGSWDVSHLMLGQNHLWVEGAASWAPTRYYSVGDQRRNGTNLYVVASVSPGPDTGLSAATLTGPTGTGTGIVDGEVTWNYVSAAVPSRLRWKATAPSSNSDGALIKPFFDAMDFGAKGDGVTDDYAALQTLVAAVNAAGGGTVYFPPGTYLVDRYKITAGGSANGITDFVWSGLNGVQFIGYGAKIDLKGDFNRANDSGGTSYSNSVVPFYLTSCQNVTLEGFEVDGNVDSMTKGAVGEGANHLVALYACKGVSLRNLYLHHAAADGLYISGVAGSPITASQNVYAVNVWSKFNARQGLSVVYLRHALFEACEFSGTGLTNADGTAVGGYGLYAAGPHAGVDVEPNTSNGDVQTGSITWLRCRFENNVGQAFIGQNTNSGAVLVDDLLLDGCYIDGTGTQASAAASMTCASGTIANCTIVTVGPPLKLGEQYETFTRFINNTLYATQTTSATGRGLQCVSTDLRSRILIQGNRFIGLHTADPGGTFFFPYVSCNGATVLDNYVFVPRAIHNGSGRKNIVSWQRCQLVARNRYDTDLAETAAWYTVGTANAVQVRDEQLTCTTGYSLAVANSLTWTNGATYYAGRNGSYVSNAGNYYRCVAAGGSTASVAPTHTTPTAVAGGDGYTWVYVTGGTKFAAASAGSVNPYVPGAATWDPTIPFGRGGVAADTLAIGLTGSDLIFATVRIVNNAEPTSLVWARGSLAVNYSPSAGGIPFWQCITAGVSTGTTWAITTAYTVGQLVANGANVYRCVVAGTSAGATGPIGTGTTIPDNTVIWNYEGPLAVFVPGARIDGNTVEVTAASATIAVTTTKLNVNRAGAVAVTLPASTYTGPGFRVKDISGTCSPTNVITFVPGAGTTLEAAYELSEPYDSITWYLDGTVWRKG